MISDSFLVSLCSVPVEKAGERLDRLRSDAPLGIVPKVAIVALVKALEANGYDENNWDFYDIDMLYPEDNLIYNYFVEHKPCVIGLSAVVSTSYSQVARIASIARRANPSCCIVLGGNMSASFDVILRKTDVDVVVHGSGCDSFVRICNDLREAVIDFDDKNFSDIPGLSFISSLGHIVTTASASSTNDNSVVLPDYNVLQKGLKGQTQLLENYFRQADQCGWFQLDDRAREYGRQPRLAGVFTTKGCVARCTFCFRSTVGYGLVDIDALNSHCVELKNKYNVGYIHILDENFGTNKRHAYEVARVLHEHDMLWIATGVRSKSITEDDVVFYKRHGCVALKYGVESGSQRILDIMEKHFSVDDVYAAISITTKHGLFSPLAVMVGMPGETMGTAMQTGRMIGKIASYIGVHPKKMGYDLFYALPLPGTPLYDYGEICGIIGRDVDSKERYLKSVSNAGIYKRYYVNLSGAPVSEFLFWDVLVALEASRTYVSNSPLNVTYSQKYSVMVGDAVKRNPRHSLKYSALTFTWISFFIDNFVVGSKYADLIPRVVLYPVVRYLLYLEYLIQSMDVRNSVNNIFKRTHRVSRIDQSARTRLGIKTSRLSLRDVIASYSKK